MAAGIVRLWCCGIVAGLMCCTFCLSEFRDSSCTTVKLQTRQDPDWNECRAEGDPSIPESNRLS